MNRKRLFNDKWYFSKTLPEVTWEEREKWQSMMEPVDLPHDWLIYNTLDLYENSIGWYHREFVLEEEFRDMSATEAANVFGGDAGRILLRFEGVYMDSTVYVNGKKVGDWKYGYSTFAFDVTEFLQPGKNEVVVKVVHIAPNSRWYSGAGIYRNVWLVYLPKVHIPMDGVYVSTKEVDGGYELLVDTEIAWGSESVRAAEAEADGAKKAQITTEQGKGYYLEYALYQEDKLILTEKKPLTCGQAKDCRSFLVDNPKRWDIKEPNLYRLEVKLFETATIGENN